MEGIIIHELGHGFENLLGQVPASTSSTITINPPGAQTPLTIAITGGTPTIVQDYLNYTGGYWSGDIAYDNGYWLHPQTGFIESDGNAGYPVESLTAEIYNSLHGPVVQCPDGGTACCVDRNGNVLADGSPCVYVVRAGQYVRGGYSRQPATDVGLLFFNENRTNPPSDPTEGLADSFSAFMRFGGSQLVPDASSGPFPETEPRRQFFEQNMCCWLKQLLKIEVGGCQNENAS